MAVKTDAQDSPVPFSWAQPVRNNSCSLPKKYLRMISRLIAAHPFPSRESQDDFAMENRIFVNQLERTLRPHHYALPYYVMSVNFDGQLVIPAGLKLDFLPVDEFKGLLQVNRALNTYFTKAMQSRTYRDFNVYLALINSQITLAFGILFTDISTVNYSILNCFHLCNMDRIFWTWEESWRSYSTETKLYDQQAVTALDLEGWQQPSNFAQVAPLVGSCIKIAPTMINNNATSGLKSVFHRINRNDYTGSFYLMAYHNDKLVAEQGVFLNNLACGSCDENDIEVNVLVPEGIPKDEIRFQSVYPHEYQETSASSERQD